MELFAALKDPARPKAILFKLASQNELGPCRRKKWERVWDEVTTCSKSCNRKRKASNRRVNDKRQDNDSDSANDKVVLAGDSLALVDGVMKMSIANDVDVEFPQRGIVAEEEWNNQNKHPDISNENEDEGDDDDGDDDVKSQLCNISIDNNSITPQLDSFDAKALRRAGKKRKKAERRAQKMGLGDAGQKRCTLCSNSVNLLIRCTYDVSGVWGMVCCKCWKNVSGGVVDGDVAHPHYRYGGLWKNRRAQKTT